jgi:RHS repeat-associated protein
MPRKGQQGSSPNYWRSTTDLTNGSGTATDTYTYDVFGAIRSQTGSSPNYWLFTGQQMDGDSGLYFLRARYYDPSTGRFLGRDPIMAAEPYAYVGNNRVNLVDPYGLFGLGDIKDAVSGAAKKVKSAAEDVVDAYGPPYDVIKVTQILDTLPLQLACIPAIVGAGVGVAICAGVVAATELVAFGTTTYQIWTSQCSTRDRVGLQVMNTFNLGLGIFPWYFQSPAEVWAYTATYDALDDCGKATSTGLAAMGKE